MQLRNRYTAKPRQALRRRDWALCNRRQAKDSSDRSQPGDCTQAAGSRCGTQSGIDATAASRRAGTHFSDRPAHLKPLQRAECCWTAAARPHQERPCCVAATRPCCLSATGAFHPAATRHSFGTCYWHRKRSLISNYTLCGRCAARYTAKLCIAQANVACYCWVDHSLGALAPTHSSPHWLIPFPQEAQRYARTAEAARLTST